jgi:hypothetical protein
MHVGDYLSKLQQQQNKTKQQKTKKIQQQQQQQQQHHIICKPSLLAFKREHHLANQKVHHL